VKDFFHVVSHGALVGIGRHQRRHRMPPFLADFGCGDGFPMFQVIDLSVGKEIVSCAVEKNRIRLDAAI
jgi:hypothetical protein